jgi:hypothetical protein
MSKRSYIEFCLSSDAVEDRDYGFVCRCGRWSALDYRNHYFKRTYLGNFMVCFNLGKCVCDSDDFLNEEIIDYCCYKSSECSVLKCCTSNCPVVIENDLKGSEVYGRSKEGI